MDSPKKFMGLSVVVIINLALQFLFQWYIIVSFGAGTKTDAFFGAMAIPQFILLVLSSSLTMVLIPIISKQLVNGFFKEGWNYFQVVGLFFSGLVLLLLATSQWWVGWILPGFKAADHELALNLARIQLTGMIFSALLSVLWSIHTAKNNFVLIETTSITANLIAFVLLVIAIHSLGIYAAAWMSVLRIALQVVFLMKVLGPYRKPAFRSPSFRETWKKLSPLVAGNIYFKTDVMVDKYLTSTGIPGELTLLSLAQQIYSMANNIINKVFIVTLLPSLSLKAHEKNWEDFYKKYTRRFWLLLLISIIVYVGLLIVGKPILALIFSFKNFSAADVHRLWVILVLLFGFWFGGLIGNLTTGTFYTQGDTKTPTIIFIINFTLYVPIKIYCFHRYGITGLALSISFYMLLNLFVQMIFLEKYKRRSVYITAP
jgi:putative peptidoglycan lipid II flippase